MIPKMNKYIALTAVLLMSIMTAACSNGKQLKQDLQEALNNQQQIDNYEFQGESDLYFTFDLVDQSMDPLAGSLVNALTRSTFAWAGTVSVDPGQYEAHYTVTPRDGSPYDLPLLIKDNKMYFQIPAARLNQLFKDQYFSLDLGTSQPLRFGTFTDQFLLSIVQQMDSKSFQEDQTGLSDDAVRTISIKVTDKNKAAFVQAVSAAVAAMLDDLSANGLITPQQANRWKEAGSQGGLSAKDALANRIRIEQPGFIKLSMNEEGFVVGRSIDLSYTIDHSGSPVDNWMRLTSKLSNINQNPPFKQDIPVDAKPFEEVLKLLGGQ